MRGIVLVNQRSNLDSPSAERITDLFHARIGIAAPQFGTGA